MEGAGTRGPDSGFPLEYALASDIGGREEQQDRVAVFQSDNALLLALADGLGGHEGGAMAAQAVIDSAAEEFTTTRDSAGNSEGDTHTEQLLDRIALAANRRILHETRAWQSGSTCVLLHLTPAQATWAHIGDSRLYFFANGKLTGRSLDHSVVEILRLKGKISEHEMKSHPDRNRLLEALGMAQQPQLEIDRKPTLEANGFLLCSDGLWEHVAESELEQAMASSKLQAALGQLVAEAKARGGKHCDNISVAAARVQPRPVGRRAGNTGQR